MKIIVTWDGKTELIDLAGLDRKKLEKAKEIIETLKSLGSRNVRFNSAERGQLEEFVIWRKK